MPEYLQGDVFQVAMKRRCYLAIVFGHIGFNLMAKAWRSFRENVPEWSDIDDPFNELANARHEYLPGQWIQFVAVSGNQGMTDTDVAEVVHDILGTNNNGLKTVITNGIADVGHGHDTEANRLSDDRRAMFLNDLMTECEQAGGFKITLISLNDVFVRNFGQH